MVSFLFFFLLFFLFFFFLFLFVSIWQHIHAFPSRPIGWLFSELEAKSHTVLQADDKDDSAFEAEFKASSV